MKKFAAEIDEKFLQTEQQISIETPNSVMHEYNLIHSTGPRQRNQDLKRNASRHSAESGGEVRIQIPEDRHDTSSEIQLVQQVAEKTSEEGKEYRFTHVESNSGSDIRARQSPPFELKDISATASINPLTATYSQQSTERDISGLTKDEGIKFYKQKMKQMQENHRMET